MKYAVTNCRWEGHAMGATVHGQAADRAIAAGRATEIPAPRRRKIRTGTSATSPTREPTEETTTHDRPGADPGT